ncbi:CHASE domain-containing protein [Haliea sp.]
MPTSVAQDSPTAKASTRSRVLGLLTVLPFIALFTGAIITAAGWQWAERANRSNVELRFDAHFQELVGTLEHQIDIHILALRGIAGLFGGNEQVTRTEFHDYVATMQLSRHLPGVQAVGYVVAVSASKLAAHVDRVRAGGLAEYRVWPPSDRADYAPLLYVEPSSPDNRRSLGFDPLSDPVRAAALRQAAESGDVSMTPPLTLLSESDDKGEGGLVLYLPDYCTSSESDPARTTLPLVCGWVFMGIHVNSAVESALGSKLPYFDSEVAIAISDTSTPGAAHRVYRSPEFTVDSDTQYQRQSDLPLAGRTWTISAEALPRFVARHQTRTPEWVLAAGSTTTLLTALFFLVLGRNYKRLLSMFDEAVEARQQRAASQAQLELSERSHREMFAASPIPMWVYDLDTLRFLEVNDAAIRHYGYSREEFLDMQITELRPAEDRPRPRSNIAAVTTGFDDAGLCRHLTRDGRCIDVDIRASGMIVDGRRAELVLALDVTARMQAEARLVAHNQELERFNRLMVDRELAMIALKREINHLSQQLGVAPPYDLAAIDDALQARYPEDRT